MSVSAPAFDIARLKSVKPIGKVRIIRGNRFDLMHKFRREAIRVLDPESASRPGFDEIEWVNSFVAIRIANLPKRSNRDKMTREINRLTRNSDNREDHWHGVILMETSRNIFHNYTQATIDEAWADFWKMKEDLAHVV